jgi:hypothetical protein
MVNLGDPVSFVFQAVSAGSLVDTTPIPVATVTLPDGTSALPTVTRTSLGMYRTDYVTVQAGRHTIRWTAIGVKGASDVFNVAPAAPMALMSMDEMRAHLNQTDTADDDELRPMMDAATLIIERHRGEVVARRPVTEDYQLGSRYRNGQWAEGGWSNTGYRRGPFLVLRRGPVISLTSIVSVDGVTTWNVTDLDLDVESGSVTPRFGTPSLVGRVRVTYVAGYAVVPPHYIEAAKIITAHLWSTQRTANFGPHSVIRPGGDEDPFSANPGYAIPYRALELLGGRPPVIA